MDYQTLNEVINDLTVLQKAAMPYTARRLQALINKYQTIAETIEADMAREFSQGIDWENEEVKHLFESNKVTV
tara:strand:+ start:4013 stop:4231 length:219 start_codon:yes stop_codon:yes gene_type:complete